MTQRTYTALITPASQHRLAGAYLDAVEAAIDLPRVVVVQRLGLGHLPTLLLLADLGVDRVLVADDLARTDEEVDVWFQTLDAVGLEVERVELAVFDFDAWSAFVRENAVTSEEVSYAS